MPIKRKQYALHLLGLFAKGQDLCRTLTKCKKEQKSKKIRVSWREIYGWVQISNEEPVRYLEWKKRFSEIVEIISRRIFNPAKLIKIKALNFDTCKTLANKDQLLQTPPGTNAHQRQNSGHKCNNEYHNPLFVRQGMGNNIPNDSERRSEHSVEEIEHASYNTKSPSNYREPRGLNLRGQNSPLEGRANKEKIAT